MRILGLASLVLVLGGCGSAAEAPVDSGAPPADGGSNGNKDGAVDPPDAGVKDATATQDATTADAGAGNWRTSLAVCWTDATCKRALAVAHGGAWDTVNAPYDSNAALDGAYKLGIDGVKIDVRVTKDNVPVISHSSPLQIYESLDCYNKKIEEMTAADVVKCHRFPSSTETFQRLDDVLNWLRGKMVVQLCVKLTTDYARTIAEIHAQKAEDFAFIELGSLGDLQNIIPNLPGWSTVWYMPNFGSSAAQVDTFLGLKNPRALIAEFDPTVSVATVTAQKLHPAGVRSFTYTNAAVPSVAELKALYDSGFDIVSAQSAANNVQARIQVNQARSISPP